MNVFGDILKSSYLSVSVFVHLCTKYYFLSKRSWGYQVTFSDSSSYTLINSWGGGGGIMESQIGHIVEKCSVQEP